MGVFQNGSCWTWPSWFWEALWKVLYLPTQAMVKTSSTTTKVWVVFNTTTKSSPGVSLNNELLVSPTIHQSLIDVLLHFHLYHIDLTTDITHMYLLILLPWPAPIHVKETTWWSLRDYRMTRVTFGVFSSPFSGNMSIKQNALDHAQEYVLV